MEADMKNRIKKILCITLAVIFCLGALASCGKNEAKFEYEAEALAEKYFYLGYEYLILDGREIEGTELYDGSNTYFHDIDCAVVIFSEDGKEEGFFFYCDDVGSAKENEANLRDFLANAPYTDIYDLVRRASDVVYIGTLQIWDHIKDTVSTSDTATKTWNIQIALAGIDVDLVHTIVAILAVVAIILGAMFHNAVTFILVITVIVHSIKFRRNKKKFKKLIAAYEALAQNVANNKKNTPDE